MTIKDFLRNNLNKFIIDKVFPRHYLRFTKSYFGDKEIKVAEVGVFEGGNAKEMFKKLNIKKFYAIDPYDLYKDYSDAENKTQNELNKCEKIARKELEKFSNKINWIKKYSSDAIKDIPELLDFIYIDGNHTEKYILEDMKNYYKKLKVGGVLAGHDITTHDGVGHALITFCYENKLKPILRRTDWWLIKQDAKVSEGEQ